MSEPTGTNTPGRDAEARFLDEHVTALRDRFAMAALTGMMCRITRESMSIEHPESVVAGIAYKFADAMLAARKQ
jgi:hypothetical protein